MKTVLKLINMMTIERSLWAVLRDKHGHYYRLQGECSHFFSLINYHHCYLIKTPAYPDHIGFYNNHPVYHIDLIDEIKDLGKGSNIYAASSHHDMLEILKL